ncbi:hypothetical protein IFM89_019843 [Coptis chinensis]|uniref:rRNA-processing protein EFG1 n=1 Tax=Coptis chinensis TaxID=261450 RepID=A0A835HW96_9MAGN|nr:hypothetical protein IFM89_019843 [Coptis chinensis]
MGHGGYEKKKKKKVGVNPRNRTKSIGAEKRPKKSLSVKKNEKAAKPKSVSLKNQIRSTERMLLRKSLPLEVKEAQQKKLEELKRQQDIQTRLANDRRIFLRDRKIKFFERRKVERRIRRLEKLQRTSNHTQDADVSEQLSKLKEDLQYVRFYPKNEEYVSLFGGGDDADTIDKRNLLREKIKTNIMAAAANGKDLEETGSEDDGILDMSGDDFFLAGSSSEEVDADDEWTAREQASSASGKATSGMSSDEKNQRMVSARALMPPPRPPKKSVRGPYRNQTGNECLSSKKPAIERVPLSTFKNKPHGVGGSSFQNQGPSNSTTGHSSNLSSNSDAHKPRRKRRPKKKKQQV